MTGEQRKLVVKALIGLLLVLGIWWLFRCECVKLEAFTPARIRDQIQSYGDMAAFVYLGAYILNTISVVPPIAPLSLAAGLAFGAVWGAALLMAGSLIGTSCTFFISRLFGRGLVKKIIKGKKIRRLDEKLEHNGFMTVLFFRVVPVIPYEVLNYAAGLSKIKYRDYILATFLGLIPGIVIAAFFGGSLGEINSARDLLDPRFLAAAGSMGFIIAVPIVYQLLKKTSKRSRKGGDDV
ncbi:MAG: hypothetical protein GF392_00355 [Candidatus Omnitrophica bacterium]|nr:hypothetical protein [Candidatus Omnitrophota bacterium]